MNMLLCLFVLFLSCVPRTRCHEKQIYKIGGLFNDEKQIAAFRAATDIMNTKYEFFNFKLIPLTINMPKHNSLLAYNSACKLLEKGIIGLFGPSSIHSSSYIQTLCDLKEIPHIETHRDMSFERRALANVHPHPKILQNLIFDLVDAFNWKSFIIIYDTYENLLSFSSLFEFNNKGITVVLRQLEFSDPTIGGYRLMLAKVKFTGERQFVLICSTNTLEMVLKQLQEVGMMTDVYSYIIADLDMHTIDLESYQYAGTNITGIRMVDPQRPEVNHAINEIRRYNTCKEQTEECSTASKLDLESALIVDAVHLFYETIYPSAGKKRTALRAKKIECDSKVNWEEGYTIINSMKVKSLRGLSGNLQFDEEGFRTDFFVDIIELTPMGLMTVGKWHSTERHVDFQRTEKPYKLGEQNEESKFNRTLNVLISILPPYAMLKEDIAPLYENDRYEGFCIDIIQRLSENVGFNYTFVVQEDGKNGNYNSTTKKWDGMIREIVDYRADLAITDLTITYERELAVEFTMPFMNLGITILYRKPEPVPPSLFMFTSPFSVNVWIMLGASYFAVSLAIFVMGRLSPAEWQNPYPCIEEPEYLINQFSIRNSLWFTIGALMQQGTELAPVATSIRTVSGVWWFFVLIMVSSYTANLAAFLTVETFVAPFKDIKELAAQDKIKYGAKKGGATANYFRDSNDTVYRNIHAYMLNHPENMVESNEEGVNKVETDDYAFLMESTTIEYVTERHCTLAQVGGNLDDKGYGIAMTKDSPFRHEIGKALLKLQETGELTRLKMLWWSEKRGGGKCSKKRETSEATALDLQNIGGVFLVLFVGVILGMLTSLLESVTYIHRKSKINNLSFREELKREFLFFKQFKLHVKEVTEAEVQDENGDTLVDDD